MSEPVKNAEIEDVLSSIRRLVTDGGRDSDVSAAAASAQKPVQDADKLVLTDALRIEEAQAERAVPNHVPDTEMAREMHSDIDELRNKVPSFLQRKIEIEAPSALSGEAPELDELHTELGAQEAAAQSAPAEVDMPEVDLPEVHLDEARAEVLEETPPSTSANAAENTSDTFRPWEKQDSLMSEWQSVRTSAVDEFEPDAPEDGANAGTPVATLAWEDHLSNSASDAEHVSFEGADRLEDPEESLQDTAEDGLQDSVSFIHDAGSAAPEEAEDDTPDAFVEEALADTVIEGVAQVQEAATEAPYEAVLDEEMLRDLVGEIVRQELQGPLGERITRNVRKLVRREINRAMTSRSFSAD